MTSKKQAEKELIREYDSMARQLHDIYSNKSSDEYKMRGDITASPSYDKIEKMVAEIQALDGFPKDEAREINTMFTTLHRPIFKQMVSDYLSKPTETNTIYTTVYTVGYRVLVGELSRIIALTEATDNGLKYKKGGMSRKSTSKYLIQHFNSSMETGINSYIRSHGSEGMKNAISGNKKKGKVHQESVVTDLLAFGFESATFVINCIQHVFSFGAKEFNPISFFNAVLMKSYDKKIQKFEDAQKNYNDAKEAYEDYLKLPKADRKRRVEHRYMKLINRYNIKMQNLKAKIDHFDQRSEDEARERREKMKEDNILYGRDDDDNSSSSSDSSSSSSDSSPYDFGF